MRVAIPVALVTALAGCGDGTDALPGFPEPEFETGFVLEEGGAEAGHFGFGSPASEARIALWDIDVKPDGEGLPPGSGTVAAGKAVYDLQCLGCHGPTGVEGPNDRLVSTEPWVDWPVRRAVGNYWPYATTLYDYIRKSMPQATPGVLTADDTYAVIAYILHLNEIIPEDAVMNPTTLPAVMMPARDRFVRDNRTGGRIIR
jgi:cytochrome c